MTGVAKTRVKRPDDERIIKNISIFYLRQPLQATATKNSMSFIFLTHSVCSLNNG